MDPNSFSFPPFITSSIPDMRAATAAMNAVLAAHQRDLAFSCPRKSYKYVSADMLLNAAANDDVTTTRCGPASCVISPRRASGAWFAAGAPCELTRRERAAASCWSTART